MDAICDFVKFYKSGNMTSLYFADAVYVNYSDDTMSSTMNWMVGIKKKFKAQKLKDLGM